MNELLHITQRAIGAEEAQTVNARDLHAFLEVGKMFAHWIQDRIDKYGFVEGEDFVVFADSGNNPSGGRPAKEYAISIDMAKELAMVERNDKGKQARQYFIECERRAKAAANDALPRSLPEALRLAADLAEKNAQTQAALALAAPKAAALDRIATPTDGAVCPRIAAKMAQVPEKQFLQFMQQVGWITRHHHSQTWMGYSDKEAAGLLELKRTTVSRDDGSSKTVEQVLVTPRGLAKIAELIERKAPELRKTATLAPHHRQRTGTNH